MRKWGPWIWSWVFSAILHQEKISLPSKLLQKWNACLWWNKCHLPDMVVLKFCSWRSFGFSKPTTWSICGESRMFHFIHFIFPHERFGRFFACRLFFTWPCREQRVWLQAFSAHSKDLSWRILWNSEHVFFLTCNKFSLSFFIWYFSSFSVQYCFPLRLSVGLWWCKARFVFWEVFLFHSGVFLFLLNHSYWNEKLTGIM